jgi:hypothetical protein
MTTEILHLMTGQIRPGDVVLAHGMRVRIDTIRPYHPGGQGCVSDPQPREREDGFRVIACDLAWACYGTVLNVTEAIEVHGIPRSFLYDAERDNKGPGHGREDFWNVQGNNLAYWAVERPVQQAAG